MSIHRITLKDGRPTWKIRWRKAGSNRSRSFDRRADAKAFEAELRRRRQLGALAVQQLTERGGPTLGEWVELRWALEHRVDARAVHGHRYANCYAVHIAPTLDTVPANPVSLVRAPAAEQRDAVVPLAPATVERIREAMRHPQPREVAANDRRGRYELPAPGNRRPTSATRSSSACSPTRGCVPAS